ncbi:MAG: SH3 domain-containing protein [Rhodospirillaceae bacterium]
MKSRLIASVVLAASVFAAGAAAARPGYLINNFNIFTGPGRDYERLARVPENARVEVHSCLPSYDWCQVSWRGVRGWMDANGIEVRHAGAMVSLHDFGPRTGVPSFADFDDEDDDYFERRPSRLDWDDQDFDNDGVPNAVDRDRDGDGVRNDDDRYPGDPRRD